MRDDGPTVPVTTPRMADDFTLSAYGDLLDAITAGGYRVRGFDGADPAPGEILLRHDIDLSLEAALRMAELEHEHGIATTYLLMTRSIFYNLASPAGDAAVERLRALGHAVGHHALHPDPEPAVPFACDRVLAWHNPDPPTMALPVAGWTNVMEPRFTGPLGGEHAPPHYRSDSNLHWRHGSPVADLAAGAFDWLQLLIHPVLWVYPGTSLCATIDGFLDADRVARYEHLRHDRLDLD
jgi:hypothetical protein